MIGCEGVSKGVSYGEQPSLPRAVILVRPRALALESSTGADIRRQSPTLPEPAVHVLRRLSIRSGFHRLGARPQPPAGDRRHG